MPQFWVCTWLGPADRRPGGKPDDLAVRRDRLHPVQSDWDFRDLAGPADIRFVLVDRPRDPTSPAQTRPRDQHKRGVGMQADDGAGGMGNSFAVARNGVRGEIANWRVEK